MSAIAEWTADQHIAHAADLLSLAGSETAARARTHLNFASVLHQADGLADSRRALAVQAEQIKLQRLVFGKLEPTLELVEEMAKADFDTIGSAVVRGWISRARELNS